MYISVVYCEKVTFKNVTFKGYSLYTEKFKKTISSSNSLKDYLPEIVFDGIEFKDQNIPVLYSGSLADLYGLDELKIENCAVEDIQPGALKNVPDLFWLSLKGNRLKEIKEGVFEDLSISMLDLSNNLLTTIDSYAFDGVPLLVSLDLSGNRISSWNRRWIKNNGLLAKIYMRDNRLTSLPSSAFSKKVSLNNTIGMSLDFSHNNISQVDPRALRGVKIVERLLLGHNLLENIDENFFVDVRVKEFRIGNNKITCLDGDLSKIFKAEVIYIDSNPMRCHCVEKIKKWSEDNKKNVPVFLMDMECVSDRIRKKIKAIEKRLDEIKDM
nr:unnamed protein product [Callosobruchus analis]